MLRNISIKELYVLALAEGEGVGTAYEYFAKRLTLGRWLKDKKRPSSILIAGLPQKYGTSLDFLQLAEELGAAVTIVDERPSILEKSQNALEAAQKEGWLTAVSPTLIPVEKMGELEGINGRFDLCISSEVMQRLPENEREYYLTRLTKLSPTIALFMPNGDNSAHTEISGLSGLRLDELQTLSQTCNLANLQTDYIDMPPFPPGITRDEDQREQATSGKAEAVAMWGLGYYARMEKLFPTAVRRNHAHIVYSLSAGKK